MKRLLVGGGVLACLVGLGFVFPAVAQLRDHGALPALGAALLVLGTVVALGGLGAVVCGVRAARG